MLNNIKSLFFIKICFSYLNEKRKLNFIKYNKNLQNLLEINLINYKIFSGRFLIIDKNAKGKEYSCYHDMLLFEGEYLNGKRNGKGKEFSDGGNLIYEGEYLNGKRNGHGKEYEFTLIFDGEYLEKMEKEKSMIFLKIIN